MRNFRSARLSAFAVVFSLFLLALPGKLRAQVYLGSIQGEVTDSTGAKVPGAVVTAEEVGTHFKTTGKTNDSGSYSFASLSPGTYVVSSTAPSFRTESRPGVVLTAGQLQKVDFLLTAGSTSETVEVSADNLLLDAGSANIATTLSTQEVTDLPNEGRNPFVQASLAAGVIDTGAYFTGKASGFTNPFSGVAVQLTTDGSSGHNRLTIDGIPDDPAERFSGAGYTGFVPSPEAVQEVKVQTRSSTRRSGTATARRRTRSFGRATIRFMARPTTCSRTHTLTPTPRRSRRTRIFAFLAPQVAPTQPLRRGEIMIS